MNGVKIYTVKDPDGKKYKVREERNGVISQIIDPNGKSHKVFQKCKRCGRDLTSKQKRFFYHDFICEYENTNPQSMVDCYNCIKKEILSLYKDLKLERKKILMVLKSRYKNMSEGTVYSCTNIHPEYRSLEEAKKWANDHKIKTREQWERYWKNGKLPSDIPRYPHMIYSKMWYAKKQSEKL